MKEKYEERGDRAERFARIWWRSRADVGMSQDKMALELGVSKKTIQNWEKGISSPDFFQGTEWFRALGLNPIPYYMAYIFPEKMDGISAEDPDERIEEALDELLMHMPIETKRKLLFLFWGGHGGSPTAATDFITAFLQIPLRERVEQATLVATSYELHKELGTLRAPEHVQPDMDNLWEAIAEAKDTVLKGHDGYTIIDKGE